LYVQIWYSMFYMLQYKQSCRQTSVFLPTRLHLLMPVKPTITPVYTTVFLKMNPWVQNM